MLPICVRPERVCPKLSSIQGIRANFVYIVSLPLMMVYSQKWPILRGSVDSRVEEFQKHFFETTFYHHLWAKNDTFGYRFHCNGKTKIISQAYSVLIFSFHYGWIHFQFCCWMVLIICLKYVIRMQHGCRPATDGLEFWVSCKQPAFLSSFCCLQVIQNKCPWC